MPERHLHPAAAPDLEGEVLVETARTIATGAHTGQRDKAGAPYIDHPARVAGRLNGAAAQAAAWLHDVLEDTRGTVREVTSADLRAAGIPQDVVATVEALTHGENEPRDEYYRRIRQAGPLAVQVKLADIADNTDPQRLAALDETTRTRLTTKYAKAVEALTG